MSDEYQSPTGNLAEATGKAFSAFNNSVFEGEGVIPKKYRQLIALAVAMTTQCEVYLRAHAADAVQAGASEEEIA